MAEVPSDVKSVKLMSIEAIEEKMNELREKYPHLINDRYEYKVYQSTKRESVLKIKAYPIDKTEDIGHATNTNSNHCKMDNSDHMDDTSDVGLVQDAVLSGGNEVTTETFNHENIHRTEEVVEEDSTASTLEFPLQGNELNENVKYCGHCCSEINDAEECICCSKTCGRWFHVHCLGLAPADQLMLDKEAKWACTECSDPVVTCWFCEETFTSTLQLNDHKSVCQKEKSIFIKVPLDKIPSDLNTLVKMIDNKSTYCCPFCDYKIRRRGFRRIKEHLISHTDEKPYTCEVCGANFTNYQNCSAHKLIHSGENPFKCTVCSFSCNRAGNLRSHEKLHLNKKKEPVFTCNLCEKTFPSSLQCDKHKMLCQRVKKASAKNIKVPLSEIPTDMNTLAKWCGKKKTFHCKYCDYNSINSSTMKKHLVRHMLEKPFECELCGQSYSYIRGLKAHMSTHQKKNPGTST